MREQPENMRPEDATAGMPTWVKGFAITAAILAVLIVVMLLAGGHGPGRHMRSGLPAPTVGQSTSTNLVRA